MRYKGWGVSVQMGDPFSPEILKPEVLPEYLPKEPLVENTLTMYIPAQERKQFFITIANEDVCDARVFVYVDGQVASYPLCYARPKPNALNCVGFHSVQDGYLRKFAFQRAPLKSVSHKFSANKELSQRFPRSILFIMTKELSESLFVVASCTPLLLPLAAHGNTILKIALPAQMGTCISFMNLT